MNGSEFTAYIGWDWEKMPVHDHMRPTNSALAALMHMYRQASLLESLSYIPHVQEQVD